MAKLIKTVTITGTAAQFNAGMERLGNRLDSAWGAPGGERLYFCSLWQDREPPNPCRATWEVGILPTPGRRRAFVECYEETAGTRVDFMDGYAPSPGWGNMDPIGAPFVAFAKMICRELGPMPARLKRILELKGMGFTVKRIAETMAQDEQGWEVSERIVRRDLDKAGH